MDPRALETRLYKNDPGLVDICKGVLMNEHKSQQLLMSAGPFNVSLLRDEGGL